jgi:hypothetical protein
MYSLKEVKKMVEPKIGLGAVVSRVILLSLHLPPSSFSITYVSWIPVPIDTGLITFAGMVNG